MKRLLVLGGNGFVGQSLCADGLRRGWKVSSLSRSGPPASLPSHLRDVTWYRGSAADPASYVLNDNILRDVDYVVHSIGLLFADKSRTPQELSVETCQIALDACIKAKVKAFGFVSAAQFGGPIKNMLSNYYQGKNDTEQLLIDRQSCFERVIIARPGMMYGPARWSSRPVSWFYNIGTWFTGGVFPRAIPVDLMARCLLDAMDSPDIKGVHILEVKEMLNR